VLSNYDWDWVGAEREYRRAIELNPNYPTAHHYYGTYLSLTGRHQQAIAEMLRAQELDPFSPIIGTFVGKAYYYARQYDDAVVQYRKVMQTDPNFAVAAYFLSQAYEEKGMYQEAIAELERGLTLEGTSATDAAEVGLALRSAYKKLGAKGYFQERLVLKELEGRTGRPVSSFDLARLYAHLDDRAKAFEWLSKAHDERNMWVATIKVDPKFDRLRADPRFADTLRRVGLEF